MTPIAVSDLNLQIKASLDADFGQVSVRAEVGRVTVHASGHIYFALKDEKSSIDAVLFRGNAARLKFTLETGMQVIAHGAVSVYIQRGTYSINCTSIEPDGAGALAVAYEQLKKKLDMLGWFRPEHKKPLPKYPRKVALITSATGAALQDMRRVADKRWRLTRFVVVDSLVQGASAAPLISAAIARADTLGCDAIVLARGGGSPEDLWCFNDEMVARAIFECKTPLISAIGHEIDYVISDFVADQRAATPSAAMELLLPDQTEELRRIDDLSDQLGERFRQVLEQKRSSLNHLKTLLAHHSLAARFGRMSAEIAVLRGQLAQSYGYALRYKTAEVAALRERLLLLDPAAKLPPKVAQIVRNGTVITVGDLTLGDTFELIDKHGSVQAQTIGEIRRFG